MEYKALFQLIGIRNIRFTDLKTITLLVPTKEIDIFIAFGLFYFVLA
jgi:hypothetical protein